jgi:hypothetical protein
MDEYELVRMVSNDPFQYCTDGLTSMQLLKMFIDRMIAHNGGGYVPAQLGDPCNTQTVVSLANCWVNNIGINNLDAWGEMTPCAEGCCYSRYEVCFSEGAGRHISRKLPPPEHWPGQGTVSCPPSGLEPYFTCATFCPVLEMYPQGNQKPILELSRADNRLSIRIDNPQRIVTVTFRTEDAEVVAVDVVDMKGSLVTRREVAAARQGEVLLDASSWSSGTYMAVLHLATGGRLTTQGVTIAR